MNGLKRAGCLLAVLLLLPVTALGGRIEQLITTLTMPAEHPVEIRFTGEAIRIPALSEERTGWLNRLLKHLAIRARFGDGVEEETLEADGQDVFSVTRREGSAGTEARFSFDSGTIYRSADGTDVLSAISGIAPEESPADYYSDILVLADGFYSFFEGLPEAFPEYSTLSKSGRKFKDYGIASQKWSIAIPEEVMVSDRMAEYIAGAPEPVRRFLAGVTFSGRQRFTLLRDESGRLMKVNYTGNSGTAESGMRRTDLDWQCLRGDGKSRDVLKLKTPATSGSNRDNITLERETAVQEDGTEQYSLSVETDRVVNRVRTLIRLKVQLEADGDTISGGIQETRTSGGKKAEDRIALRTVRKGERDYSGSIEIIRILDKIEGDHFRIDFTAGPCEAPEWTAGRTAVLNEAGYGKVRNRMATIFLKALFSIPEKDLQYILADLPAGWWEQTRKDIQNTEGTEEP